MWKNIAPTIKELFFPTQCFFCKKYGKFLCQDCNELLEISPVHRQNRSSGHLTDDYAACSYENNRVKKLILSFKYHPFCKELAAPIAGIIDNHFILSEQKINFKEFIIIPVPLAAKRLRWRGFNQAQAIAEELAKIWRIPMETNCLKRIKETRFQAELSQSQRRENVKNVFACANANSLKNKSIFLIDDVITTGATMNECARVLSKNGSRQIIGIAAARAKS